MGIKELMWTCHKNPIKRLTLKSGQTFQPGYRTADNCLCGIVAFMYILGVYTNRLVLFSHGFCQPNQHNICSTSSSTPSQFWKNHWMACHYLKSPNSAGKKNGIAFFTRDYNLKITALNFTHISKLYPGLYVIHLKRLTADFIALRVF